MAPLAYVRDISVISKTPTFVQLMSNIFDPLPSIHVYSVTHANVAVETLANTATIPAIQPNMQNSSATTTHWLMFIPSGLPHLFLNPKG
jgi:hypothetical protein